MKINQYFDEVRQLLQGFKLPNPIEFYYHVAETAFEFVNQNIEFCRDLQHNYIDFLEAVFIKMNSKADLRSKMIPEDNILTITNLNNQTEKLNIKKIVELIIFSPPFLISDEMIAKLESNFACKIKYQTVEWKDNLKSRTLIYLMNSHHFKIFYRLDTNKFVFFIGFNEKSIKKSLEITKEKLNRPNLTTYNSNTTLQPFIKNKDNLDEFYIKYLKDNLEYINISKKYISSSIKVFDELCKFNL